MSKLLWPLFIYYLTVSQRSCCEDQLLFFLSGFSGIFLLLEPDLSSVSPWPSHSFTSPQFQRVSYFCNTSQLISVLSFHLWPFYFETCFICFETCFVLPSSFSKLCLARCHKSSGVQYGDLGEPSQCRDTHLEVSRPQSEGHLIQRLLRHQGDLHKVMFAESFSTKEHF